MPRPNKPRTVRTEAALAQRIAVERERRGWTYDEIASRMTAVGCPINGSSIYKIEKGTPPRGIRVDELTALSLVFDIPIEQLVLPPDVAEWQVLIELLVAWDDAAEATRAAAEAEAEAWKALREYVDVELQDPEKLEVLVAMWAGHYQDPEMYEQAVAYTLYKITGSDEWREKWLELETEGQGGE